MIQETKHVHTQEEGATSIELHQKKEPMFRDNQILTKEIYYNLLKKELGRHWLIFESVNNLEKTLIKTYSLEQISVILSNSKVLNKIEWTQLIKAYLEKLIKRGLGEVKMEVKIKHTAIPY